MSSAIGTLAIMSIMVIIATVCVNEAKANGAACQLYGHSCLGGHGKRSSSASVPNREIDSDAAIDAAASAAFQAKMTANRLNGILREMIARRMVDSAAGRMNLYGSDDGPLDVMEKKTSMDYSIQK